MAQSVHKRAYVKMGVDIDDADLPAGGDIAEEMSVSRLVASAKDDWNRSSLQDSCNHRRQ